MHLKSLTVKGFKSFASATTLNFEPGITCVVGPNGSGKSNVVDAIAWVMGEQGAKSLRGGKMEDVIFAGTADRAPLGRAEVSLTIDNTDGSLPIDYTEVTISRILFRTGGSEYSINGAPARLLDVQELLSDSGIGREMHVIVGQGQLDSVLHATPEDRRGFVEEAAGVLKHRKRKEKALRKLDSMNANLVRLNDLIAELRRQLKPLGRQAEVARRAQVIQSEVRDSRLRLLADDCARMSSELDHEAQSEAAIRQRQEHLTSEVERLRSQLTTLNHDSESSIILLRAANEDRVRFTELRERFRSLIGLTVERIEAAAEALTFAGPHPDEWDAEIARRESEAVALAATAEACAGVLAQAEADLASAEQQFHETEQRQKTALNAVTRYREKLAQLEGRVAAATSRVDSAEDERSRLMQQCAQADHDRQLLLAAQSEPQSESTDPVSAEQASLDLVAASDRRQRAREALTEAQAELEHARKVLVDHEQQLARAHATLEALQSQVATADGIRELEGAGVGVLDSVEQAITVTGGWDSAIEAALTHQLGAPAVAVTDAEEARRSLEVLSAEGVSRAAVLVVGAHEVSPAAPEGRTLPTGAEWAAQVLSARGENPAIAAACVELLRDVVVAEDADVATAVLQSLPEATVVTRRGEVIHSTHVVGGSAGPGQLATLAAIDAANERIMQLDAEVFPLRAAVDAAAEHEQDLREQAARAEADWEEAGRIANELQRQQAVAESELNQAQQRLERLTAELTRCESLVEQRRYELTVAQQQLEDHQATESDCALPQPEEDLTHLRTALIDLRKVEVEARLSLRSAQERHSAASERAASLRVEADRERAAREKAASQWRLRQAAADRARGVETVARDALSLIEARLDAATDSAAALTETQDRIEQEIHAVSAAVSEADAELATLMSAAHRDELARAEQRIKMEQLADHALQEYGLSVEQLLTDYGPDVPVPPSLRAPGDEPVAPGEQSEAYPFVRADQEKRLRTAEKSLALLGKVNPLALEEFAALEERHTFLSTQLDDLKRSQQDLLGIVSEVDERVRQVFAEAFADVQREFTGVFSRLFPGGEGRLVLTHPDDLLSTGIEVEARPAGKKVKRLSLLSGGERSLTAVAFLVSLFKARPSPFYLLDEVEAALDDVNLQRLIGLIEELRGTSQLLIITHQKKTMEVADALYGVTMKQGVTQVISQRIRELHSV